MQGNVKMVRMLLDHCDSRGNLHADVNINYDGNTALNMAGSVGG
jgi:hypothetical protein